MHFGLFNLMGYRDEGTSTRQVLCEAVEQTRLAEQAGFEMAWFAEHHFSNYCVCPSPLMMAAHCAGVTTKIRLATGVVVLPLYNPARLIAEIGMVDSLSNGRLVLGVGSGYQPYEFERFGADLANSKEATEELLEMIALGLTEEFFSFRGKHYQQMRTHIGARGNSGLPEIWVAGEAAPLQRYAARKGYVPIVSGRLGNAASLGELRRKCEEAFAAEGKDPNRMPIGVLRHACVTSDKREAEEFAENVRYQLRLAGSLRRREEVMVGHMLVEKPQPYDLPIDQILANLMIGDAETCAERAVAEIRSMRPLHLAIYFQVGNFGHKRAMKSIERFATDVMPKIVKEIGPLESLNAEIPAKKGAAR